MLGKLLKYDLRATAGTMLISYVILLGYALILQLAGLDLNFSNPYLDFQWIMRLFLYVGFVIVMVGVLLFTYVQILRRFYNNLVSAQGYLTNTLPVRPEAILVSKVLMGVIWIAVTYLILMGCTAMLGTDLPAIARSVLFSNLRLALENTPTVYFVLTGILLVLSPFASVLTFFACICLGQLFSRLRVFAAVLTYLGWALVEGVLTSVATSIAYFVLETTALGIWGLAFSIVYYVVVIVVFFLLCRMVLRRYLNLE